MTKLSYIGSVDFLHVSAALAGERDAGRPVPMKCLIAVDHGPQAKRAYGGSAVARLQGRARDDGRPGPHLGEPPTEEQLLSSTSTPCIHTGSRAMSASSAIAQYDDDVPDVDDNCPFTFNPAVVDPVTGEAIQADRDGDGIGDVCDSITVTKHHSFSD